MNYPERVIKVGETDGAVVKQIAQRLDALGYKPTSPVRRYDAAFKSLVKLFQSQHVDVLGRPLRVDGEIGPVTWGSLFGATDTAAVSGTLAEKALATAITQIGVRFLWDRTEGLQSSGF